MIRVLRDQLSHAGDRLLHWLGGRGVGIAEYINRRI